MSRSLLLVLLLIAPLLLPSSLVRAQQRLARPQNLRAAGNTLSWDAVANASGYRLRWLAGGKSQFHTVTAPQTQYSFTGLSDGAT